MLFMLSDLDWDGYCALKKFEQMCLSAGRILDLKTV